MKRPSNLILAFVFAVFVTFSAYAIGRIALRAIQAPTVEIEDRTE